MAETGQERTLGIGRFRPVIVLLLHGGSGHLLEREKYEGKAGRIDQRSSSRSYYVEATINAYELNNKS